VNALSNSILLIRSVETTFSDSTGRSSSIAGLGQAVAQYQLTTQSQTDIVLPSDKSVISTGRVCIVNQDAIAKIGGIVSEDLDHAPQMYAEGYLVATDSIFLGGAASTDFSGNVYCSVVLECEVTTMTSNKAMALALSQQ